MSNYPAGAENDPRAPWNIKDPEPRYAVFTNEFWDYDDNSLGFEVVLAEVDSEDYQIDVVERWENHGVKDSNDDFVSEEVDEYIAGTNFDDAERFYNGQVQFYINDKKEE